MSRFSLNLPQRRAVDEFFADPDEARADTAPVARPGARPHSKPVTRTPTGKVRRHVDVFGRRVVMLAILANTASMGLALEFPAYDLFWASLEHGFTAVFALEMLLKLCDQGRAYFRSSWNRFDFVVTWAAIVENWVLSSLRVGEGSIGSLLVLRSFRLLRLARMLRAFRISDELMVLVEGLVSALRSMVWITVLLGLLIYCSAVYFTDSMSTEYEKSEFDVDARFGSVTRSFVTLIGLCLFDDFSSVAHPMAIKQPLNFGLLMAFLLVASLGMLNLVVGVITDSTFRANQRVRDAEMENIKRQRMANVYELADHAFDSDDDNRLSVDELKRLVTNNSALQKHLESIELPIGLGIEDLHHMFDQAFDHMLTKDEFTNGMFRLLFSDDFQRNCLLEMNLAHIKRQIHINHEVLKETLATLERSSFTNPQVTSPSGDQFCSGGELVPQPSSRLPSMGEALTEHGFLEELRERLDALSRGVQAQLSGRHESSSGDLGSILKQPDASMRPSAGRDTEFPVSSAGNHGEVNMRKGFGGASAKPSSACNPGLLGMVAPMVVNIEL